MKKRFFLGAAALVIPLVGGGLIGYNLGRPGGYGPTVPAVSADAGGLAEQAQTVSLQSASRDTVNDQVSGSRRNAITRTVAMASPAVVGINVIEVQQYRQWSPWGDDPFFRRFFGDQTYSRQVQELGSGFVISSDGYILTNDHVAGNAKEITVTMTNGEKHKAELIGTDQVSDVALLKIDGKNLPSLRLGNSDDVIIGEWVIALGNPFGLFAVNDKPTVTVGVVSSTGMNLSAQEGRIYKGMIQTDAAINAGNSGGPLVNSIGEVIGVNAVIFSPNREGGNIGLGFAIPINRVKGIMAELKRSGKVEREFWTGLEIQAVDRRIAKYFGLEKVEGVIISDVKRGSPGDRSGFKVGDIILAVNGEKVTDESSLMSVIDDAKVNDVVALKVIREKKEIQIRLKLEKRTL
jgi:serine protease Do